MLAQIRRRLLRVPFEVHHGMLLAAARKRNRFCPGRPAPDVVSSGARLQRRAPVAAAIAYLFVMLGPTLRSSVPTEFDPAYRRA